MVVWWPNTFSNNSSKCYKCLLSVLAERNSALVVLVLWKSPSDTVDEMRRAPDLLYDVALEAVLQVGRSILIPTMNRHLLLLLLLPVVVSSWSSSDIVVLVSFSSLLSVLLLARS